MADPSAPSGVVIVLPDGGGLGGVTVWASRTCEALLASGHFVGVVGPGISNRVCADGAIVLDSDASIRGLSEGIGRACGLLAERDAQRVYLLPQLSGEAYAATFVAAARLSEIARADCGRGVDPCVLGWMHTDIAYDIELIRRFWPGLSGVVCVSEAALEALASAGVGDSARRWVARTGCVVGGCSAHADRSFDGPLRLIYAGRLDAFQKRALTLPGIVAGLRARGADATLTVAGAGPACAGIEQATASLGIGDSIELLGEVAPERLCGLYRTHHLLVQPSRSEGLGLARIEAAMLGCVPFVTPGGSAEGIISGTDGVVVDVLWDQDDEAVAAAFAGAIAESTYAQLEAMSGRAIASSRRQFSMDGYAARLAEVLASVVPTASQRAAWESVAECPERAAAFTVPDDVEARLRAVLSVIGDQPIALHGAGMHTRVIWGMLAELGVRVVAVCDDDPERWGGHFFGVPVVPPANAGSLGASSVLISSWLHQDAVWARRGVYEAQGLGIIRAYPGRAGSVTEGSSRSVGGAL